MSVDLDSARTHLAGYGVAAGGTDRLIGIAAERLLRLLGDRGVMATFFVVGRDAAERPSWLGSIVAEGHEVASHSMEHPMGFTRLSRAGLRDELARSRAVVEDATGAEVRGFRSPNWDVSGRVLSLAARTGYRYDASLLPTPLLIPARLVLAAKSGSPASLVQQPLWPTSLRRLPHAVATPDGEISEIPVSVTPLARWPVYHTLRYRTSDQRFGRLLDGFRRRGEPLSYPMHAIDVTSVEADGLDRRLTRHPGAGEPLRVKLDLAARTLDAIVARFTPRPLAEVASAIGAPER